MFSCKSSSQIVLEVAWSFHNSPQTGSGHSNKVLVHYVLSGLNSWLLHCQTIPADVLGHRCHQDNLMLWVIPRRSA